jgi:hypothetical protein
VKSVPHHAVLLHRDADLAASFVVRADGYEPRGDALVFLREDRVVHQVPQRWVAAISVHDDELSAREAVAAHRRTEVGGATIHVQESAPAAPRRRGRGGAATAVPAEGISIRIDEGRR